jgi:hypothetical protein
LHHHISVKNVSRREGAHAAGDFLPDFHHADFSFGGVVERASPWGVGEAQVVVDAFETGKGGGGNTKHAPRI